MHREKKIKQILRHISYETLGEKIQMNVGRLEREAFVNDTESRSRRG